MKQKRNSEVIDSVKNGEEDVLLYLADNFFDSSARILRRTGIEDIQTPVVFANTLVQVYQSIQQQTFSNNIDFEQFFLSALRQDLDKNINHPEVIDSETKIVSSCFTILSSYSADLLASRYSGNFSFEKIADKFNYSNPVIAEFEFNKSFSVFENIVHARLETGIFSVLNSKEKIIADQYLNNILTGSSLNDFMNRLEKNKEFASQIRYHNLLTEGIKHAEHDRLYNKIISHIGYKKPLVPFSLKLIFTFLVITAGGIILWNYIGQEGRLKNNPYLSLDFLNNKNTDNKILLPKQNDAIATDTANLNNDENESENNSEEGQQIITSTLPADSVIADDDFIVRKDQMLISYDLKPVSLDSVADSTSDNNLEKKSVEKLNPEGGLPELNKEVTASYNVEFWLSPVNYRGYKLSNEKLILFGIDEPDVVQLFVSQQQLLMKYGKDFYSLEESDKFLPLTKSSFSISALR